MTTTPTELAELKAALAPDLAAVTVVYREAIFGVYRGATTITEIADVLDDCCAPLGLTHEQAVEESNLAVRTRAALWFRARGEPLPD